MWSPLCRQRISSSVTPHVRMNNSAMTPTLMTTNASTSSSSNATPNKTLMTSIPCPICKAPLSMSSPALKFRSRKHVLTHLSDSALQKRLLIEAAAAANSSSKNKKLASLPPHDNNMQIDVKSGYVKTIDGESPSEPAAQDYRTPPAETLDTVAYFALHGGLAGLAQEEEAAVKMMDAAAEAKQTCDGEEQEGTTSQHQRQWGSSAIDLKTMKRNFMSRRGDGKKKRRRKNQTELVLPSSSLSSFLPPQHLLARELPMVTQGKLADDRDSDEKTDEKKKMQRTRCGTAIVTDFVDGGLTDHLMWTVRDAVEFFHRSPAVQYGSVVVLAPREILQDFAPYIGRWQFGSNVSVLLVPSSTYFPLLYLSDVLERDDACVGVGAEEHRYAMALKSTNLIQRTLDVELSSISSVLPTENLVVYHSTPIAAVAHASRRLVLTKYREIFLESGSD